MITIFFGVTGNRRWFGCSDCGSIVLAFDFDVVLFSELIYFNAFRGQLFLSLSNQLFQLFFCVVQLWQHIFHRSLTQHTANQPKTFPILINRFQGVDDCSVNWKKEYKLWENSYDFFATPIYFAQFLGYVQK